jgi:hypothetical protein
VRVRGEAGVGTREGVGLDRYWRQVGENLAIQGPKQGIIAESVLGRVVPLVAYWPLCPATRA